VSSVILEKAKSRIDRFRKHFWLGCSLFTEFSVPEDAGLKTPTALSTTTPVDLHTN
jgi:hypothetical protein